MMTLTKDAATEFLALTRVAVTGVSGTDAGGHGSNTVYTRMRDRGYEVFPVNPNSPSAEGDKTYPGLRSIPDGVQAVFIGTRPDRAEATMQEAIDLGITHVWMHRAFGSGATGGRWRLGPGVAPLLPVPMRSISGGASCPLA